VLGFVGAVGALFIDDQLRGFSLLGANDTNANFPAAFLTQVHRTGSHVQCWPWMLAMLQADGMLTKIHFELL
jgi:hypothetical protein